MTLSEELKRLFKEVEYKHIDYLKELVFEANKQAVKELKEEIKLSEEANGGSIFVDEVFEDIEKIFGDFK